MKALYFFAFCVKLLVIPYLLVGPTLKVIGLINKYKQCYVHKSNLGIREKNVKLHIEVINVVVDIDSKLFLLRGDVFAPNNGTDQEYSL